MFLEKCGEGDTLAGVSLNPLQSLFLGMVQGLTEFLPISSSAHLILVPRFLDWPDSGLAFDVSLHLGTLAGVLAYFWKDLLHLKRPLLIKLALATLPAALLGLLLESTIESSFRSPHLIAFTLIGAGLLLAAADSKGSGSREISQITLGQALLIGLAQSAALVPGVSRSGATITAALFMGFVRRDAARFSFLMSIPIIAGAGGLKINEILASPDHVSMVAGFAGAALSGFLAIWGLMRYVQSKRFTPFVIYRCLLGLFILLFF